MCVASLRCFGEVIMDEGCHRCRNMGVGGVGGVGAVSPAPMV